MIVHRIELQFEFVFLFFRYQFVYCLLIKPAKPRSGISVQVF
jgi:hypothetical protein